MVDFSYQKQGIGINKLIFLHGFGEDHHVFDEMIAGILKENLPVTCYALDIFYHGNSPRKDEPLTKSQWKESFGKFLQEEKIDQFSLIGFSLGGRFSIATAISFPKQTKAIYLIAPDGIHLSIWYRIANSTLGNKLFKFLMDNPKRFDELVAFCKWTRLAPGYLIRFTEKTLNTQAQRQRVYRTWTYFYPLQHRTNTFTKYVNQHKPKIYLILGEIDKLVPPEKIIPKIASINSLETKLIPAKHHQMIDRSIPCIISALKNQFL
ncbi:MAG: alpha/beta hydrolase [Bacteroidota bacterium]